MQGDYFSACEQQRERWGMGQELSLCIVNGEALRHS